MRFIRGTPKEFRWAVSGAGGYVNNSVATGEDIDGSGLGDAIWKGGVAGAVGGGVGSIAGNYMAQGWAGMSGGFAGGATGSALNGGNRWEILQGGLMGAGVALGSYSMVWGYNNLTANDQTHYREIAESPYEKGSGDLAELQAGRRASPPEKLMVEDFSENIMQTSEARASVEVAQNYKLGYGFWRFNAYAERVGDTQFFKSTSNNVLVYKGANAVIHSHPNYAFPSNTDLSSIGNIRGYIYFQPKMQNTQPQLYHYDSKYYRILTY